MEAVTGLMEITNVWRRELGTGLKTFLKDWFYKNGTVGRSVPECVFKIGAHCLSGISENASFSQLRLSGQ